MFLNEIHVYKALNNLFVKKRAKNCTENYKGCSEFG